MAETLSIIIGLGAIWGALYVGYNMSVKYFSEHL